MEALEEQNFTTPSIYRHPSLSEYYTNLTPFVTCSIFISVLLLVLNIAIFGTTASQLRKRLTKPFLAPTTFLCSLYPIICIAAVITIFVPKSWLACHTVMHVSFTLGAVAFRSLCFHYVGSELSYVKETDGTTVAINTPPCCCCCLCLPALSPSKVKLCVLRYMVWQMPMVQGSIMLVLSVIYYREPKLYATVFMYFMPFIVCSILMGLWSLNITMRMVHTLQSELGLMKKLFCLQLILLLCKLQYMVLDSQMDLLTLGGPYPINHTIYKQTIINLLILVEMVPVSLLAKNAYKTPTNNTEFKLVE